METVVRLSGVVELTLKRLVELGYFKTRTEALRAGVLQLGKEYRVLSAPQDMEDEMAARKMQAIDADVAAGRRKTIPLHEVLREYHVRKR